MKNNDHSNKAFRKFVPIKELSITREGGGITIGLGRSEDDHKFYLLTWRGNVEVSGPFSTKELAEVLYRERVEDASKEIKQQLEEVMKAGLAGEVDILDAGAAAIEFERLDLADDQKTYNAKMEAREFRQTHTSEEVMSWVRETFEAQLRQEASEVES
jgi:hypothetical protein